MQSLSPDAGYAAQTTLSWIPPTTNEDGTPITNLSGYKVYYGTATKNYTQTITLGNVTTCTVQNLADGTTYYFAVTAVNSSSKESKPSNEISRVMPAAPQYALSVSKSGTGTGTVSSAPAGISCGSDCSEVYNAGTSVTLTAGADKNSLFEGWSGVCSGKGSCTVALNAAKTVTATFTLKTKKITSAASTGGGISPSGTVTVNEGANQTFTITANVNYAIADVLIDGNSMGAINTYTFSNVTADHTINASFVKQQDNMLSVNKSGTGTGIITSVPAGISCGSDCTEVYSAGTSVTLTAAADAGSVFGGWSGACSGTGSCTVTLNAAKTVNATFTQESYTITVTSDAGGKIAPSGSVIVNRKTNQTFIITPNNNHRIGNVMVDGISVGPVSTYTFTSVEANHTIYASFMNESQEQEEEKTSLSEASGGSSILPKTGQTVSYASGDDGDTQAGSAWPEPRFTDNGDGTVTDALTGLMWLKDGTCLGRNSYGDALNVIADFNSAPVPYNCSEYTNGYADWRLPDIKELESIVNFGVMDTSAWLSAIGFSSINPAPYWAATTSANSKQAFTLSLYNGTEVSTPKSKYNYVMAVRDQVADSAAGTPHNGQTVDHNAGDAGSMQTGTEWSDPWFTDNGDGTVTDTITGLMWLKDGSCLNKKKWNDALNTVAYFNSTPDSFNCSEYSGNYNDWRMPNIKELESLVNYGMPDTSSWLNTGGFINVKAASYWSSTVSNSNPAQSYAVTLKKAKVFLKGNSTKYYVMPVRSGSLSAP